MAADANHTMERRREEREREKEREQERNRVVHETIHRFSTVTLAQMELVQKQVAYANTLYGYWGDTLRTIQDSMQRMIDTAHHVGERVRDESEKEDDKAQQPQQKRAG